MPQIHLDTDLLRRLAQDFTQIHTDFAQYGVSAVYRPANQLEYDWQGIGRQRFQQDMAEWWAIFNQLLHQSETIALYLSGVASDFENAQYSGNSF
ncbi:MAG: WXG100 family type VII secretion target [Ktedonobacteraceae bacterium]|nr:WXG100 family type VII secretion target [Ktedonobacteraceae bacterium]